MRQPASSRPPRDVVLNEDELDEALKASFPASDPPAITPIRIGAPAQPPNGDHARADAPADGDASASRPL
jgi:hypothetical protein